MATLTQALKDAIQRDGRPPSTIAAAVGVDKGMVSRFLRDERTLTATTVDRLCEALAVDVRLVRVRKPRRTKRKGGDE